MNESRQPDNHEQFVKLSTRSDTGLRAYVQSMLPMWHDADGVMQEVTLAAWHLEPAR